MRKKLFVVVLAAILAVTAFAHSGRTDSRGGHWNHSTGEYHYHHGYSAHQHTDGVCPYAFDDKTSQSSSSQKKSYEKDYSYLWDDSDSTADISLPEKEPSWIVRMIDRPLFWAISLIIVPFIGLQVFLAIVSIQNKKREKAEHEKFLKEQAEYKQLYEGKMPEELAGMPQGVAIGEDGLPKESTSTEWGDSFTFYVSYKGSAYHKRKGCSGACFKVHACQIGGMRPCQRCFPTAPDLSWYFEYMRIKTIKEKYEIE